MTGQINVNKIVARSGNLITYDSADVVNITLAKGENTASTNLKQGLAKEWTLFDQAGNIHGANTIGDSFNVSSCTDISTGHFDVNLSNNMNSTAYSPVSNHHYTGLEANDQYSRFSAPSYLRTTAYRIAGQYVNSSTGYEDGYFTTGMNGDLA